MRQSYLEKTEAYVRSELNKIEPKLAEDQTEVIRQVGAVLENDLRSKEAALEYATQKIGEGLTPGYQKMWENRARSINDEVEEIKAAIKDWSNG